MKKSQLLQRAADLYDEDQLLELAHAIDFASDKHKGQKRKSGEPYITHPLSVAGILIEWGMDIDTILAGVLHDTIEDTETTINDIESLFGRDVAFLVDGVTKVSQARANMRDISSYLPATKDNLSKLLIAVGQDVRVIIIKLADRLHNLQTLEHMPRDKQLKIARESLEVFAPLADRLNMGRVRVQIEELSFSYLEPREYKYLRKAMKDRLGKSHRKLATVRHDVDLMLTKEGIGHTMDGRIKSVYSLYKKLKKVDDIDDVYDLIALRIIVTKKEDCYRVLGLIHSLYQPMVNRIKDYIAVPKPNGYQSLHTTIITRQEQIVEFQIRTQQMHEYAERGLAASFHYNEQKLTDEYRRGNIHAMPAHLEWINELQEVAARIKAGEDVSMDSLKLDIFANRIFVYSPKGDIYDLPEGAFPLDYAYRIHSDIGKHTAGFKVNNKMVPFDRQLRDGDIVEVLTKRSAKPKIAWLEFIATDHAREKLKAQIKKVGL
ncbi:bifunctional (p)ppGpp synthetase/guanosine-3',5'-bis(diphosphate) 3'-pyrophosphohydrolase [Pedobacter sp.]|nr:bifunctional (p)ppGpp synthetase/guanosine-3',5'-bis(diphosphate) 3'-pyrophosphohydrolase [Candidatus Saccharibacteria bacterium]